MVGPVRLRFMSDHIATRRFMLIKTNVRLTVAINPVPKVKIGLSQVQRVRGQIARTEEIPTARVKNRVRRVVAVLPVGIPVDIAMVRVTIKSLETRTRHRLLFAMARASARSVLSPTVTVQRRRLPVQAILSRFGVSTRSR